MLKCARTRLMHTSSMYDTGTRQLITRLISTRYKIEHMHMRIKVLKYMHVHTCEQPKRERYQGKTPLLGSHRTEQNEMDRNDL